jgi:polyferredoxin
MKKRRIIQYLSLLLLHSSWGPELKWFCNPVLSCHSCVLSWFACPVGVFVHFSGYHIFPLLPVGMVLLAGVFVGRLLCGWVCPFGLLQDLLHKIPSVKISLPHWTAYTKYALLFLLVILTPYLWGESTMYSFCRICPAGTLQASLPAVIAGGFSTFRIATLVRWSVLAAILMLAVVSARSFCKVLCPLAAVLAPLNYLSLWTVKAPAETCRSCGKCDAACSMDITPSVRIGRKIPANRDPECIVCHECQAACVHAEKGVNKRTVSLKSVDNLIGIRN